MPNPVAVVVELDELERGQLEGWSRRRTSAQALALRSRIVLLAAEGVSNSEIAARLGVDHATVRKCRNRFAELRLDGLSDEPRPGRPRTITDAQVEEVIVKTLESTPRDATHWSTRSMAREVGLTQTAVSRIWRAFGLQPHRQQAWKLSRDPQFIEKVRDVVGLYLNPPERAVVLCVDEKSQIRPWIALRRSCRCCPAPSARDARLQARGHLQPLRRVGHHLWQGHRRAARAPPRDRVQEVPGHHRPQRPRRARRSPRTRQQLDAQDAGDPALAGRSPTLRLALHPDQRVVAEPRRALVLRADDQETQARRAPLRPPTQHSDDLGHGEVVPLGRSTPLSARAAQAGSCPPCPASARLRALWRCSFTFGGRVRETCPSPPPHSGDVPRRARRQRDSRFAPERAFAQAPLRVAAPHGALYSAAVCGCSRHLQTPDVLAHAGDPGGPRHGPNRSTEHAVGQLHHDRATARPGATQAPGGFQLAPRGGGQSLGELALLLVRSRAIVRPNNGGTSGHARRSSRNA
jgi:transposase